ncbi:hypothetical protein RKD18_002015 [Streptomyces phaeoluteigriseus]
MLRLRGDRLGRGDADSLRRLHGGLGGDGYGGLRGPGGVRDLGGGRPGGRVGRRGLGRAGRVGGGHLRVHLRGYFGTLGGGCGYLGGDRVRVRGVGRQALRRGLMELRHRLGARPGDDTGGYGRDRRPRRVGALAGVRGLGRVCFQGCLSEVVRLGRTRVRGRVRAGHDRLGGAPLLGLLLRGRNNRFRRGRPGNDRRLDGRLGAPGRRALRRHLAQVLGVEVLGCGRGRARVPYRRARGAAVGEGADRARGGVGDGRAEVQGAPRCHGRRRRVREADGAEVDGTAVTARRLVRAGFVHRLHHRLGRGRRDLVAPGALGTGQQQQVFVLGGGLGEVGVRAGRGDALLLHHACVLRQSLARNLAGVGHAYPSPIG